MGPPGKGGHLAGLNPQAATAAEPADEAFPGEEEALDAAEAVDAVIQAAGEGNNVAGVDNVIALDIDFDECAVGVEPKVATT